MKKKRLRSKNIILIFILASIFILIRFQFYFSKPLVYVSEDTYSYYSVGAKIINEKSVNISRPPIYPLILQLSTYISGVPNTVVLSTGFFSATKLVVLAQSVIGIFSILVLYFILKRLKINNTFSIFFCFFISFNIICFCWDKFLLTESFAFSSLVFTLFLLVQALKKPKIGYFIALYFICSFNVFLRPIFFALPFASLPIIAMFHQKKKVFLYTLLVLVFYSINVLYYSAMNYKRYHVFGLTSISDINLFGKILQFDLPIDNAKDEKFYYNAVLEYKKKNLSSHPFRFFDHYSLVTEDKLPLLLKVRDFNKKVLLANIPEYTIKSIAQIPEALLDVSEKTIIPNTHPLTKLLFSILYSIYQKLQYLFFLIFPLSIYYFYLFITRKNIRLAFLTILASISLYQIFVSVFLSYGEFGRLIVPAQPIMYLFVLLGVFKLLQKKFYQ